MQKRTQVEIEKDYKVIKEAAEKATSFKELESITGLTYAVINVSLSKHPRVYDRIKKKFAETPKTIKSSRRSAKVCEKKHAVLIDTSITGVVGIEEILKSEERIILTSVVIKELSQMQHFEDAAAMRARHILTMPADYEDKFVHQLIDENFETADECILEYCKQNAYSLTLYTADKEMYNFAKIYKIPVKLFKPEEETRRSKITTLKGAFRVGNDLILDLDAKNTSFRSLRIISDGKTYDEGMVKLKIGDEILLASKKPEGYIAFAHYKLISLWKSKNCVLVFSRRLEDLKKLDFNHEYKSFLRTFKRKIA